MKGLVLDLDGTLRRGKEPVPGAVDALMIVKDLGLKFCYLTNNSTRERSGMLSGLVNMGFPEAPVITSAQAASVLIRERFGKCRCLALGEKGLQKELELEGHETVMAGTGPAGSFDAVVVGLDRTFDYAKLKDALDALREGALFIATNEDPTLPVEGGKVLPGSGTIVSAVRTGSGKVPLVVGKPQPFSTLLAVRELGLAPSEVLVVGDRYDTDVIAGRRAGCMTALVLTGDPAAPRENDVMTFKDVLELATLIKKGDIEFP